MVDRSRLHDQTPAEYFKELVDSALDRQQIRAGDLTAFYLVNLLCQSVRLDAGTAADDSEPLALKLVRALASGGQKQRTELRRLGDCSLFVSGFFSDSLRRRAVDVDYYITMGAYAYGSLSREDDTFAEVFGELSGRFVAYMDVLTEVSEQTALSSSADVFRLYEKWLRTGSPRSAQQLVDRGVVPNVSIGRRFVQ